MAALRVNMVPLLLLADSYKVLEPSNTKEKLANQQMLIGFRNRILDYKFLAGFKLFDECLQALSKLGLEIQRSTITVIKKIVSVFLI